MQKLEWNLTTLFEDKEAFHREIKEIETLLEKLDEYRNISLTPTSLKDLLDFKWSIKERTNRILIYGSLSYYKNTADEYAELKKEAEEFTNRVNKELSFIDNMILTLERATLEDFYRENPDLEIYRFSIENLFRMADHVQPEDVAAQIKENNDAIGAELKTYNALLGDVDFGSFEIEGQTYEIAASNFAKLISSKDREIRRQTYLKTNEAFSNRQEEFIDVLDTILANRLQTAKLEGYNSVLEKVLFEENISLNIIESLIRAVETALPTIRRYLKIKADYLNITDPHLYDYTVPLDFDCKKKFSLEEAVEVIKEAIKPLGEEYTRTVEELLENSHIDAEPDENKHQAITFSWATYSFLNFRGAYGDLKNLIHELGHIVNYRLSEKKQPFPYVDSTVFIGETASIINELLLNRYLLEQATTDEDKIFYLSKEIENFLTSVFKQTMYTEFENYLYTSKEKAPLESADVSAEYASIVKKYYGEDVAYDAVGSSEWTRLGHIYRWSYYPYKYATGLLIASTVLEGLDEGTIAPKKYIEFLSRGSSMYSLDLLKKLGVDIQDDKVITEGFKILEKDVAELEDIMKRLNKTPKLQKE